MTYNEDKINKWMHTSAFQDDPDYIVPTLKSLQVALKLLKTLNDVLWSVYPDGEGGISFEYRKTKELFFEYLIDKNGMIEKLVFNNCKIVERELIGENNEFNTKS